MGYSIAMFGAFNVYSYGDTLFPIALYQELSKRIEIDNFIIFSLGRIKSGYFGKYEVHSYEEFEQINQKVTFDAIIIGGGELLHNRNIEFEDGKIVYRGGMIWQQPLIYGKKYHIPVILNSVGMPYEFLASERNEMEHLLSEVSYVSLRDRFSYLRWKNYFGVGYEVKLVPDSLWCLENYFAEKYLNTIRDNLKQKHGISSSYLVLQYGTTRDFQEVANIVERFSDNTNMQMVVIAVNASHEDKFVVENLVVQNSNTVILAETLLPEEIAAIIIGAKIFIGTSLHGNLTAAAFGVKNVVIDMYPEFVSKLDGFAEMTEATDNFVGEISDLWDVLNTTYDKKWNKENCVRNLKRETQEHYSKVCDIITSGSIKNNMKNKESMTQKEVLFQKGYYKVDDGCGQRKIYKMIAENIRGVFAFPLEINEKANTISFSMPLSKPTKVILEEDSKWLIEKNAVTEDIYIAPILQWKLVSKNEYNLKCKISQSELSDFDTKICQAYREQALYIEQFVLKEREYLVEIASYRTMNKEIQEQNEGFVMQQHTLEEQFAKTNQMKLELEEELLKLHQIEMASEQEIVRLQQEVLNKQGHIELLLPAERELIAIKKSLMFRFMRCICKTLDVILFVPKMLCKKIIAFGKMMTHVNVQELKIAYGYVKNEGMRGAYCHLMKDYHQGELKQMNIEVSQEIYDEITDIHSCNKLVIPFFEKPQVSIIIPAYNQFAYTYYCIKSIIENSSNVSYEIILADDCSSDLTMQIKDVVENIVVVRTRQNLLFLRNCNNAARYAQGEYILFLNNDTQVQKDWLKPLVDLCERDNSIGMVGSKLVYADGTLQEAGGIIWKDGSGWNYGRNDDAMKPEYNYVRETDYISGAAIMIRKGLWDVIGGFDEYFAPAYCEDSDLAFMVRKNGYKVVYQPLSVVVHYEGKSNGTDLSAGVKKYQIENSIKLKKKWQTEFSKQYENAQCVFKARERSKDKKVILVIDHYVPQFDKDAGSKTTYQYLKMFVKEGYSVKFIGDNFYQDEPYTTILQQMGVEVLYGPWYAQHWQTWILENQKHIDFVYLNRPHITIKYIDFLKEKTDIKCIYYGHDLHFLRLRREYQLTGNQEKLRESDEWLEKELYIMRCADISYYPSYVEEQAIHEIDPDIRVKAITAYVYENFLQQIEKDFTKREGIVFVGGFGHPPNEDAVLWFAKEIYPLIQKQLDIPFYIVGSKPTEAVKKLHSGNIVVKGFVSEEELARLYGACKLVVVPLRYGAGVKGKVVEALYYGTPMVTTSVGVEGISGAEKIIDTANNPQDFAETVIELYKDNVCLAHKVDLYQKFVKEHFSVDAVWDIIKDDFI